jgi:hypothetical protein
VRDNDLVTRSRPSLVVARNPDEASSLPYLLRLPIDGGLALKARDSWPRSARVYCHPLDAPWPPEAEVLEEVPITVCRRRGAAIDLVLDRLRLSRSQFVFTEIRGRPAIFWQTQKAARGANPGARVPRRKAASELTIIIDSRERYPFRFTGRSVETQRAALPAGDYGVAVDGEVVASVERKVFDNFTTSLSDGTLAFQMQRLAQLPLGAIVVEGRYADLFRVEHAPSDWLADVLARLQVRYPELPVVFADSRKFAEEWTYRFLATATTEVGSPLP